MYINNCCIVFDFDCTLTYTHLHMLLNNPNRYIRLWDNIIEQFDIDLSKLLPKLSQDTNNNFQEVKCDFENLIFGGNDRLCKLAEFLKNIKDLGIDIYIASRGNYLQIVKVLELFNLMHLISDINASSSPNYPDTKDVFMQKIITDYGYSRIYYIDDDSTEHMIIMRMKLFPNTQYVYFGENIGLYKEHFGITIPMMQIIFDTMISHTQ